VAGGLANSPRWPASLEGARRRGAATADVGDAWAEEEKKESQGPPRTVAPNPNFRISKITFEFAYKLKKLQIQKFHNFSN